MPAYIVRQHIRVTVSSMIKEILLLNLPPFALLAGMWIIATLEQRQRTSVRPPVKDKLLRPPGHTLAKRVEELQETTLSRYMLALITAVMVGSLVAWRGNTDLASQFTAALLASLMVAALVAALRPRKELRNCALGLRGEQMMAEELDKLTREGYWIFHDFPGGPDWNIDHVAVGPAGVFAIETKTRRKRDAAPGAISGAEHRRRLAQREQGGERAGRLEEMATWYRRDGRLHAVRGRQDAPARSGTQVKDRGSSQNSTSLHF